MFHYRDFVDADGSYGSNVDDAWLGPYTDDPALAEELKKLWPLKRIP